VADATRIVRTCEGCQSYARQTHLPAQALQTVPITWPFSVWGLDLVGPLQKAPGGYTHPWEGLFVIAKVLKPEQTSWPTVKARSTPTLGTSNSYVASTLKMFLSCSYTSFPRKIWSSRKGQPCLGKA
jgi:hypothetical protein